MFTRKLSENLRMAMTETLLAVAGSDEQKAVCEALHAMDEMAQQSFEALLLVLQACPSIAREKRDVILDVMASIAPDDTADTH